MKILIDGFFVRKKRGLGRYVRELIYSLSKNFIPNIQIYVLISSDIDNKNDIILNLENINYIKAPKLPFPLWEQTILPLYTHKLNIDIVHCPYNTFPILFLKKGIKFVVTIHDLNFFTIKGASLYQRIGNTYRKKIVGLLKNPNRNWRIITDSYASKQEIQSKLGLDAKVIYISVESFCEFCKSQIVNNGILSTYGIKPHRYFLHIGGTSHHKNTESTIKAFLKAKEILPKDTKLVITGMAKKNPFSKRYKDDSIIFPGWIEEREMCTLYKNCYAILFPSFKEGFGLPIAEGIYFNKPIITSNIPPMNEIGKKGTVLINPFSIENIYRAIVDLFYNKDFYNKLRKETVDGIKLFRSESFAKTTYEVYKDVYTK